MSAGRFIEARLAEWETWAEACEGLHWQWVGHDSDQPVTPDPFVDEILSGVDDESCSLRSVEEFPYDSIPGTGPRFLVYADETQTTAAGHIIRHDPARVLAEVAALRAVVRILEGMGGHWNPDAGRQARAALAEIAGIWSDHPDHEDWT